MTQSTPNENPQAQSELLEKAKKFLAISGKKEPNKKPLADLTDEITGSLETPDSPGAA
ncbi:MAG: hypothetical protein WC604_03185 [Candidatus Gracilibacteria bacterium]